MWGALTTALGLFFATYGVKIVVKILLALGISVVAFTGADFALTEAQTYVMDEFNGIPADALGIVQLAGFGEGLAILFAGYSAYIGIKVAMGAFTQFVKS